MKVSLIDYTGYGARDPAAHAMNVLIFTKATRLNMSPGLLAQIETKMPLDEKLKELEYMANTIPSSWEFVHYTFLIEGVTRAFTHQFVRTRTASFAQQTMRVLDVSDGPGWSYATGPTIPDENTSGLDTLKDVNKHSLYHGTMHKIEKAYKALIEEGAAIEDARGILPTNILTNIVMSCNMRTFVEMVRKRSSSRTQGEYRDVLEAMKAAVRSVHPFIDIFIARDQDAAINDLEKTINTNLSGETRTNAIKLLDQLRAMS